MVGELPDDILAISDSCRQRHGEREWRSAILTHEIHGHLGIYSTLGVKMGVRAREWFEAQGLKGDISILSFAGLTPPVSCLNDGLQISTGSTLGHGLISVSPDPVKRAEARFTCEGQTLTIKLKEAYETRIRDDIEKGVSLYGHAPAYWQYIRTLALQYWNNWSREAILDIVPAEG